MNITDRAKQGVQNIITWAFGAKDQYEADGQKRKEQLVDLLNYYKGNQHRPLKVSSLGKDYNVISNHVKTIVDRSVSMLIGAGVEFDLPGEGETKESQFISMVWDANKKYILLHDVAQFGGIYGTPVIKISPNSRKTMDGSYTYRLIAINPYNLSIFTSPDDVEEIKAYVYRWNDGDIAYRELTRSVYFEQKDELENVTGYIKQWTITTQVMDSHGKWIDEGKPIIWEYEFSPIVHGKNLPNAGNVYGYSDIEGILELQDRYNEGQSNENKILVLQAFAQKYVINGKWPRAKDDQGNEYLDVGPDKALEIKGDGSGDNAKVGILEPTGDLSASRNFINDIRRDMFEIAATVDSETVKDKVGALTNFGLRVLFKNELAKNATKQLLYAELLLQVNSRLLQLEDMNPDPGKVIFGDPLPSNDTEVIDNLTKESTLGVTSKETIAKELGRDWTVEQERMTKEKTNTQNIGANSIRDFLSGRNNV